MKITSIARLSIAAALLCSVWACSHTPPPELSDARRNYEKLRTSNAVNNAPAPLHDAEVALQNAEKAFAEMPNDPISVDLAYIALRKTQIAEQENVIYQARADEKAAQEQMAQAERARTRKLETELEQTKEMLNERQKSTAETEAMISAVDVRSKLQQAAVVADTNRGVVITVAGEKLFSPGKSTLLPTGEQSLDRVAEALISQKGAQAIRIEGHTDSSGKKASNQRLSEERAIAVRDYLVSRGVPSEKVQVNGLGSSHPIASNNTKAGRAHNRRIEIVVQPSQAARVR